MPIESRLKSEYLSIGHVSSPEAFLAPYAITKSDNDGRELGREFPKSRKTEFAHHVRQHGTDAHFVHYGELQTLIDQLRVHVTIVR